MQSSKPPEHGAIDDLSQLCELQDRVLASVRRALRERDTAELSRPVRDEEHGDTIFGIDTCAEEALLGFCADWGRTASFLLMAEGIEPQGRRFGPGEPEFRLVVDPVDGSRGLMHDKRSAWCLAAIATEHGDATRLRHVRTACMTELPTTKQGAIDRLWAQRGAATQGLRIDLADGSTRPLTVAPSQAASLHGGFGTVADYFPGGKAIIGRVAESILIEEMGGWDPGKAQVFSDQYISSAGQMAEVVLGRDRFVLDIRPLVFARLSARASLCARPYDLCTALIAEQAGVVVRQPDGSAFDPPLDVTTNIAFAIFANQALADRMQPMISRALADSGL